MMSSRRFLFHISHLFTNLNALLDFQVKATDQGSPPRSSTARLDIEWIAPPPPSAEPIAFDEPHFTFAVMETEPVTHMVGIIMTETHRQRWFDIIGEVERVNTHTRAQ